MNILQEQQALYLFKTYSLEELNFLEVLDPEDAEPLHKAKVYAYQYEAYLRENKPKIDVSKRKRIHMR